MQANHCKFRHHQKAVENGRTLGCSPLFAFPVMNETFPFFAVFGPLRPNPGARVWFFENQTTRRN